jgi:hypothetical protein
LMWLSRSENIYARHHDSMMHRMFSAATCLLLHESQALGVGCYGAAEREKATRCGSYSEQAEFLALMPSPLPRCLSLNLATQLVPLFYTIAHIPQTASLGRILQLTESCSIPLLSRPSFSSAPLQPSCSLQCYTHPHSCAGYSASGINMKSRSRCTCSQPLKSSYSVRQLLYLTTLMSTQNHPR